jgi:hypothetical protein
MMASSSHAVQARPWCAWHTNEIVRAGPEAFGYSTFEEMWKDFFVFAAVRNPYTRAASSYDYIYGRHEVGITLVQLADAAVLCSGCQDDGCVQD